MSLIPIKFRVLELILQHEGISNQNLLKMLKETYHHDRSVNSKNLDNYLLSLKTVGLIKIIKVVIDQDGNLQQCYKITEYGATRIKYIC